MGGNRKESPRKEVEGACDANRGTLLRKEIDGNEVQERRGGGREKMVGQCEDRSSESLK